MAGKLKRYSVHVRGYDPVEYVATSASKARYRAWQAYREAGLDYRILSPKMTFREFLTRIDTTLHFGRITPAGRRSIEENGR